jgi:hypothetical protein
VFVRPTLSMDQREWTAAHVEAFAFFGGVTARLVSDNLETGVDNPTCTTEDQSVVCRAGRALWGADRPRASVQTQGQGPGGARLCCVHADIGDDRR